MDQDRSAEWDANKQADSLLLPGGGLAVWVPFTDKAPAARAAMRKCTHNLVDAVTVAAALQLGVESVLDGLAKVVNVEPETFKKMVADIRENVMRPKTDCATRIMPAPRTQPPEGTASG